jgi:hypothetical protein
VKRVLVALICLSVLTSTSVFARTQETARNSSETSADTKEPAKTKESRQSATKPTRPEDIKKKVASMGIAKRVTVILQNGNEYYGGISKIGEESFEVAEIDLKQQITVAYEDVRKIKSGFGKPNPHNGKRWPTEWHTGWLIATVGITVFLITLGTAARH